MLNRSAETTTAGNGDVGRSNAVFNAPASTVLLCENTNAKFNPTVGNDGNSQTSWGLPGGTGAYGGNTSFNYSTNPMGGLTYAPGTSTGNLDPASPTGRHSDASEYLLMDGHVKHLRGSAISSGQNNSSPTGGVSGTLACGTQNLSGAILWPRSAPTKVWRCVSDRCPPVSMNRRALLHIPLLTLSYFDLILF